MAKSGIAKRLLQGVVAIATVGTLSVSAPLLAGEPTYDQYCKACHDIGLGPKPGDPQWQQRLADKGGIDGLLASTKAGVNAAPPMPAMGTCVDCSDDQLKAAIAYLAGQ